VVRQYDAVETVVEPSGRPSKIRTGDQITYPHVVRKGSVSVTIYRFVNAVRGEVFEVTWFKEGMRKRKSFRGAAQAFQHAEDAVKALDSGKGDSLALSGSELESYRLAKRILAGLDGVSPLHAVVQEYVAIKRMLGDKPLVTAIEKYLSDEQATMLKPVSIPALVEEFISSKRADGVSERYLQDCRSRLGRFGRDFNTILANVKTAEMDTWLRKLGHSPRSRNNYRVLLVTLFRFARACGYLPRDRSTEADHVARAKDRGNPIEIYSPEEIQKLLMHADERLIPFLAFGGFAGLRTAEILRLRWENVRWGQDLIEIKAAMAKTAQRRLVPLSPNLKGWLIKWKKAKGPVIGPIKLFMRLQWLAEATEIKWKRNALRHSYASYRLAIIQDAGKLALEMGNSPSMVFRHYRELVTLEDAKAWFAIVPPGRADN
jgi:integrase